MLLALSILIHNTDDCYFFNVPGNAGVGSHITLARSRLVPENFHTCSWIILLELFRMDKTDGLEHDCRCNGFFQQEDLVF